MKKQILKQKDKLLAISDQLLVSGTNFTIGILITREAGVADYGQFAIYWMIFLFLQGICNAYIGLPAQILSSQHENRNLYLENNNRLGATVLGLFILLLYPAFLIYDVLNHASFGFGYWLLPLTIILFLKHEMNRKYCFAKQLTLKVVLLDSVTYFLQLPLLFYFTFQSHIDLNILILIMTCTALLGQITFYIIKDNSFLKFDYHQLPIRENWNYARHLIFTSILQWFSGNILLISAGSIVGISAVGIIRILQNILGVLHVLFLTLENVVPVKASLLLNNHGKKYMLTYFKKVILVVSIVYGAALILLKVFGGDILSVVYGAEYLQYSHLLDLFLWVYVLIFFGTIAQIMIKTLKLNFAILLAYILTVFATILLANPLLEAFSIKGVIIGFGILQLITLTVYFFTLKRILL